MSDQPPTSTDSTAPATESDWRLVCGDAVEVMRTLPTGSVGAVITDPPYGITACHWDIDRCSDEFLEECWRVMPDGGALVVTASGMFTADLLVRWRAVYRYKWVWVRVNSVTGQLDSKRRPLRMHEDVLVFSRSAPRYFPVMIPTTAKIQQVKRRPFSGSKVYGKTYNYDVAEFRTNERHPPDLIFAEPENHRKPGGRFHPTQKPVKLMRTLVLSYTLPGETVLDPFAGSGSTGVAALRCGRKFIGVELDETIAATARKRLEHAKAVEEPMFDGL
jgi:DNA modification methylase